MPGKKKPAGKSKENGSNLEVGGFEHEIEYLSNKWRVTKDMVKQAIELEGYDREKIENYLSERSRNHGEPK